jgi:L-aspartate oxidase
MNTINQQGELRVFDYLVIGSGLAGIYCCLNLAKLKPKARIALISKVNLAENNSRYAQGGLAAVVSSEDSVALHIKDTLQAGDGLCYEPTVQSIITLSTELISDLAEFNVNFDHKNATEFLLAKEGGHSVRRILHVGDKTGAVLIDNLLIQLANFKNIECFENHIAVNLITKYPAHDPSIQGEVLGAYILNNNTGKIDNFIANATILATGGAGKTYRYTSNPMVATGDGVAMAYRAGARISNMEFYQFHPTLLHHHQLNNFLISEAVRGEGGILVNAETGERFMKKYAPQAMELATRDIVSRAIFNEIETGQSGYVNLDITHHNKVFLQKRFPQIFATLQSIGIDMSQEPIPVVPAAHYQCGGVLTDLCGTTDLKRLFAIGEVACTGLHGANRLASNSLLETLIMGKLCAENIIKLQFERPVNINKIEPWHSGNAVNYRRASQINAHWRGLRGEMTSFAGIIRTEAGLHDLQQLIAIRKASIEEYYWQHAITRDLIELRNIAQVAELIVSFAIARRESRGGHYREDYPNMRSQAIESIARLMLPANLEV